MQNHDTADALVQHSDHETISSLRLYLLAAALSLSPGSLMRYAAAVRNGGNDRPAARQTSPLERLHKRKASRQPEEDETGGAVEGLRRSLEGPSVSTSPTAASYAEFPSLLHSILHALVLPFSNSDGTTTTAAVGAVATPLMGNSTTDTLPIPIPTTSTGNGNVRGASFSIPWSISPNDNKVTGSENVHRGSHPSRSSLPTFRERLSAMGVLSHPRTAPEDHVDSFFSSSPSPNQPRSTDASNNNNNNSSSHRGSDGEDSDTEDNSNSSTCSGSLCSDTNLVEADNEVPERVRWSLGGFTSGSASPRRIHSSHCHSLSPPDHHRQASLTHANTSQLLRELAAPLLSPNTPSGTHAPPTMSGHNHSSNTATVTAHSSTSSPARADPDARMEQQQSLQFLPRELHTTAGVSRLTSLCPPFLPLLLEALLKESVRGDAMGLAARRAFLRLVELAAPVFAALRCPRTTHCAPNDTDPTAAACRNGWCVAVRRLARTAVALFEVWDDASWALAASASLIAARLLGPGAVVRAQQRAAAELARTPQHWRPAVALAYCLVTADCLRPPTDPGKTRHHGADESRGEALQWRFPERVPVTITLPTAVVMTCMILRAGPLSAHTVTTLGQWCLRALTVLPVTPCAIGLTHLMLRYPQFLATAALRTGSSSSASSGIAMGGGSVVPLTMPTSTSASSGLLSPISSGYGTVRFCDAVVIEACVIASSLLRKASKTRMDGRLAQIWQSDTRAVKSTSKEEEAEDQHKENHERERNDAESSAVYGQMDGDGKATDAVLDELNDVQCYLMLLLQALAMRRSIQLSRDAQDGLANLFSTAARLRIAVGSFPTKVTSSAREVAIVTGAEDDTHTDPSMLRDEVISLVDAAFRATARAVDVILHDYDAGCPRRLCDALSRLLTPHKESLTEGLRRVGAWAKHEDCLETLLAAAEAYREAGRPQVFPPNPSPSIPIDTASVTERLWQGKPVSSQAMPRSMSLLSLQETVAAHARSAAETTVQRSGAEVQFGSLAGVIPSSAEPLQLAEMDGGMALAQQRWWVRRMVVYLTEEWWRNRTGVCVRCRDATGTLHGVEMDELRRSFLQLSPQAI